MLLSSPDLSSIGLSRSEPPLESERLDSRERAAIICLMTAETATKEGGGKADNVGADGALPSRRPASVQDQAQALRARERPLAELSSSLLIKERSIADERFDWLIQSGGAAASEALRQAFDPARPLTLERMILVCDSFYLLGAAFDNPVRDRARRNIRIQPAETVCERYSRANSLILLVSPISLNSFKSSVRAAAASVDQLIAEKLLEFKPSLQPPFSREAAVKVVSWVCEQVCANRPLVDDSSDYRQEQLARVRAGIDSVINAVRTKNLAIGASSPDQFASLIAQAGNEIAQMDFEPL